MELLTTGNNCCLHVLYGDISLKKTELVNTKPLNNILDKKQ